MAKGTPVLSGVAGRPFPAILSLDYPVSRCGAWLNALQNAQKYLPAKAIQRLIQLHLDGRAGKIALCALLFPVDVVTPDISAATDIKVYLKYPSDMAAKVKKILDKPMKLALTMALIGEIRKLLSDVLAAWPARIVPGSMDLTRLEQLVLRLDAFWSLTPGAARDEIRAYEHNPDSPIAALLLAKKEYEAGRFEKIGPLLAGFGQKQQSRKTEDGIQSALMAYALSLMGEAHLHLGRLALAERDFDESLKKLQSSVSVPDLAGEIFLNRAFLARRKNNLADMCASLQKACGYGLCGPLLEARLRGFCQRSAK